MADYTGNDVMVVKFKGAFPFHSHPDTDDVFAVLEGEMEMEFETHSETVSAGEIHVVPKGVTHRPRAAEDVQVLLIEPKGTPKTGDAATAAAKPRI